MPSAPGGSATPVDLVVLAGGRGERLGGADKAALEVGGRSLLGRLLDGVAELVGRVVVVTPHALPPDLPRSVDLTVTCEDPPDGGPVAGIAAGLAALSSRRHADGDRPARSSDPSGRSSRACRRNEWVAVVAVDQPGAARALRSLIPALPSRDVGEHDVAGDGAVGARGRAVGARGRVEEAGDGADEVDAVSHLDPTGHRQWLLAVYRRPALEAAVGALPSTRHTSVKRLVSHLRWATVEAGAEHLGDVDTPDDLAVWRGRLP